MRTVIIEYRNDENELITITGEVDDENLPVIISIVKDGEDIQDIIDRML
jgi:hypothetical protein